MKLDLRWDAQFDVETAKIVGRIADDVKGEYVDLIERIGTHQAGGTDWWVSDLASLNPQASRLYEHLWKLALVEELVGSHVPISEIRVETRSLRKVLARWLQSGHQGNSIRVTGGYRFDSQILLGSLLRVAMHGFRTLARVLAGKRDGRAEVLRVNKPLTLIDIYAGDSQIQEGRFVDRFYGDLMNRIPEEARETTYYIPLYYGKRWLLGGLINRLRSTRERFLFPEDFLRFRDYLFAAAFGLRFARFKMPSVSFREFDITPLLKTEKLWAIRSGNSVESLLRMRFALRLRERGVRLRFVLNWFENQSVDKGFNWGFRNSFPETPVVGYQGFYPSDEQFFRFPTALEHERKVIPEKVFVIGVGLAEGIKRFCPDLRVDVAPAFRFSYILQDIVAPSPRSKYVVLVALPIGAADANYVMNMVEEACLDLSPDDFHFLIKPHPAAKAPKVRNLPSSMELVKRDFITVLGESSLVIAYASSTGMEALLSGRRVIVPGNLRGPTIHSIPSDAPSQSWQLVYSAADLAQAIRAFCRSATAEEPTEGWYRMRAHYCEPVTTDGVARLMGLGPHQTSSDREVGAPA